MAAALAATAQQTSNQLFQEALRLFSEDRPSAAEPLLRQALQQRPRWFEARFLLGAALVSLARPVDAIPELRLAHQLNPANLDCAKLLAAQYLSLDQPGPALAILRPRLTSALPAPDEELLLLGIEALHLRNSPGDAAEALRLCTRGLVRYPRSAPMLTWRGYAQREQGAMTEAKASLEAALKLEPNDASALALLADVTRRQGYYAEALLLFNEVLRRLPIDIDAMIGKSRTLAAMGQSVEALEALRSAVTAAPSIAALRLELSQLCSKLDDRDCAAREAAEFKRLRQPGETKATLPPGLRNIGPPPRN